MKRITPEQQAAYDAYCAAGRALVAAMQPINAEEVQDAIETVRDSMSCLDDEWFEVAAEVFTVRECVDAMDEEGGPEGVIAQ